MNCKAADHMHCMLVQVAIQKPGAGTRKQFKYDKVFGPDSNQEQVYEDTKALIRSVLDGTPAVITQLCLRRSVLQVLPSLDAYMLLPCSLWG